MATMKPDTAGNVHPEPPITPHELPRSLERWLFFTIFVLAILVRVALVAQPTCISRDGVIFVEFAHRLADDPGQAMRGVTKQPGMSCLMLLVHGVLGPVLGGDTPDAWQLAGQLIALAGGVATCLAVVLLTRRLFDSRAAIIAGVLAALWPHGVELSSQVLSDMPHLALYCLALLLGYRSLRSHGIGVVILAGLVTGLAYLVRQEAIGLLAALVLCHVWRGPAPSRKGNIIAALVLLACFAAMISPHSVVTGRVLGNKGPEDLLDSIFGAGPSSTSAPTMLAHVIPSWQAPGRMVELWCKSGRYVFSTLCLAALFIKWVPRAERKGARLIALAVLMQLVLVQLRVIQYGEISSRYLAIPALLCIPWAAAAFVSITTRVASRIYDPSPARRTAVWFSAFLVALTPLLYYVTRGDNHQGDALRAAGEWLREHRRSDDVVATHGRLRRMMYHAGLTYPADKHWKQYDQKPETAGFHWFVDLHDARSADVESAPQRDSTRDPPNGYPSDPTKSFGLPDFQVRIFERPSAMP